MKKNKFFKKISSKGVIDFIIFVLILEVLYHSYIHILLKLNHNVYKTISNFEIINDIILELSIIPAIIFLLIIYQNFTKSQINKLYKDLWKKSSIIIKILLCCYILYFGSIGIEYFRIGNRYKGVPMKYSLTRHFRWIGRSRIHNAKYIDAGHGEIFRKITEKEYWEYRINNLNFETINCISAFLFLIILLFKIRKILYKSPKSTE